MTVTRYSKQYLINKLGFEIDDKSLFRNMSNMGLSIERATKEELDVEFWNRPDLMSTIGLARAIRYFMRRSRSFDYRLGDESEDFTINVGRHASKIRPYIAGLTVRGMKLSEEDLLEIINFTERLSETYGRRRERIAIGLHDLKEVAPPFFYDAYEDEEFIPLHTQKRMKYSEVIRDLPKGEEYGALGNEKGRYVALKDTRGTMSLIPILNSERTRVTKSTAEMLIDITGGSRYIIEKIADLLAANFLDMGYEVNRIRVKYGGSSHRVPGMESEILTIPLEQISGELGVTIGFNNIILLANKMGYEAGLLGRNIKFSVPPYRLDIINEQDVIEDVAIAYGYDYIQPLPVPATQVGTVEGTTRELEKIGETMVGLGYSEMLNSYLTNEKTNFARMRIEPLDEYVKIANPRTETFTMFRTWVLPSLLGNLGQSMHDKLPIRIFESDMAFGLKDNIPEERYHLAAVVCDAHSNFNEIKASFEGFAQKTGIDYELVKMNHPSFIEGRCAGISLNKSNIGFLGELHPEVLTGFGIEEPTIALEIELGSWLDVRRSKAGGDS